MSIQLLTAVKPAPAEAGAKSAAAGEKSKGEISFSAVLAGHRQADTAENSATLAPKQIALKQVDTAARKTEAPAQLSARELLSGANSAPDKTATPLTMVRGDTDQTADVRADQTLAVSTRSGERAHSARGDLAANADPAAAGDKLTAQTDKPRVVDTDAQTATDNDTTVFADISWDMLAVSAQHNVAGASQPAVTHTTNAAGSAASAIDPRATSRAAPALHVQQLSLQNIGQAAADGADAGLETPAVDPRVLQTTQAAQKPGQSTLRLAAGSDALMQQGEDALTGERARIAMSTQNTPADSRSPAAWAAFAGDAFQPGRSGRFASPGTRADASDALDIKSLPTGASAIHTAAAASSFAASAQPATMAANVQAPLGSEAWKQAINQQALRLTHLGDGAAELTLYPRELGQLHVSLKMGEHAQLHFASAHAEVRAAVEAALPQLRHAFAESGISLGQTSVSDQGTNPNSSQENAGNRNQGRAAAADSAGTADTLTAPVAITTLGGRTLDGGIDIFA